MSATSDLVLVTGAGSYTGAYIVRDLLACGRRVRAVVRPDASKMPLRNHFADAVASGALTFAHVADMAADRAFDSAVKDVTGVIHAAAHNPDGYAGDPHRDLIEPTINGVTTLLRSAAREDSVKSVVLMSSEAAHAPLGAMSDGGQPVRDETWNTLTVSNALAHGNNLLIYGAAKVQAERAAWDLVRTLRYPFRFSTIGVAHTVGATLLEGQNVNGGTGLLFWLSVIGDFRHVGDGNTKQHWAYLPDVAQGFIRALDEPRANRKRFLFCTNDAYATPREIAKLARSVHPGINHAAEPGVAQERNSPYQPNNVRDILGMELAGIEHIVREVVEQGVQQGAPGTV